MNFPFAPGVPRFPCPFAVWLGCFLGWLVLGGGQVRAQERTGPAVRIVSPIDGSVVVNTNGFELRVEVEDSDVATTKVALYREGQFLAQALTEPYVFRFVDPPVGTNLYTAVATDTLGNTGISDPVMVFVEAPLPPYFLPEVTLTVAGPHRVLTAPATVSLAASATVYRDGLDRFDFQAEYEPFGSTPVLVGEGRLNPSTLTLSDLAVGQYVFRVTARDIFGGATLSTEIRVSVVPPAGLEVPAFGFTDLGDLGGGESGAVALNELGVIVGTSAVAPHSPEQRAFLWQTGVFRGLPIEGGVTYGLGLNDLGQVVGSLATGGRLAGAFHWTPTAGMIVLSGLGPQSEASSLNREGVVVGWSGGPQVSRPVKWSPSASNLPPAIVELSPGRFGQALAINDSGRIAGFVAESEFSPRRAVVWENGQELNLGVTERLGGEWSQALGLNSAGQVVGQIGYSANRRQGFVWKEGDVQRLSGLIGGNARVVDLNHRQWSVGQSEPMTPASLPAHATLWLGRVPFDLNSLVTNRHEAVLLSADAVNERGEIVGTAWIQGQRRAYLLTPADLVPSATPPLVDLATPMAGLTTVAGESITLLAAVTPGTHSVERVDYYAGHTVVATATVSPYQALWKPTAAGDVCLRAVAVDSVGNAGVSAVSCIQVIAAGARYTLANLGDLAGREARGFGLNSNGEFVGQAVTERGNVGFVFQSGVVTYLQSPGPTVEQAMDVNDAGQVLVQVDGRTGLFEKGSVTLLETFPAATRASLGRSLNQAGAAVGWGRTDRGETHAALFSNGTVTDLGEGLGEFSEAFAISDSGVVVGWSQSMPGQPALAFIRQPDGTRTQFGSTLGGSVTRATALNESGHVVGLALNGQNEAQAFVYGPGGMKNLGTLGGLTSSAADINEAGQVVGTANNENSNPRAFLFENGIMTDLNRLISTTTPLQLTEAVAINDVGQILANGVPGPEQTASRVFLLNPSPPPGSSNRPPSVALAFPGENAVYYEGDDISLRAAAADQDGFVSLVLFSTGTNQLGSSTRPPYEITWPGVPAGTYPVTVTAFDGLGASRTSAPVMVTIRAFNPAAPKVALIGDASAAAEEDLRQNLRRTELFARVDVLGRAPSLGQLMTYDSVLVFSQTTSPLESSLGDHLATYLDAGRGVAVALMAGDTSRSVVSGRIRGDGYLAWTNGIVSGHGHIQMVKDWPDHPILAGVDRFDGGLSATYAQDVVLAPGSQLVASWGTGDPLLAVRELGAGRVVGLNLIPLSGAVSGIGWDTNSAGARLLGNSLIWAASAQSNRFLLTTGTNSTEYWPRQPITISVEAPQLPSAGVVQFFRNGALLAAVTNLPAQFIWTNAPVGQHQIVATYTNFLGQWLATPGLTVTVDSRMSLSLLTPTNGAVYSLPTNILMQVAVTNQDAAIVQVEYYIDDTQRVGTVFEPPFIFNFKVLPTGSFPVTAVATDALGARRTSARSTVTVFNSELPQVTRWRSSDGAWSVPGNWTSGTPRVQDRAILDSGISRLTNGSAVAAHLVVGQNSTASLIVGGERMSIGGQLLMGENAGAAGSLFLNGPGSISAKETVLGLQGGGVVSQSGGRLVTEGLLLPGNVGGNGSYRLEAGTLEAQYAEVGSIGFGQIEQRGGVHEIKEWLRIGNRNRSRGTYRLEGGLLKAQSESIGAQGDSPETGSDFIQTGGTHQVSEELLVGRAGSFGRLAISGGVLQTDRLTIDSGRLELMADPTTNRVFVTGTAALGGVLDIRLAEGVAPLGGDVITLMTYGHRVGVFGATNYPPATNGLRWALEYQEKALLLRALPPTQVVIVSALRAQEAAGLFHQTVTLSNLGTEEVKGSRIYFPDMPPGWQLYNAAGNEVGVPFIEVDVLIPAGSSVQFTAQFLAPESGQLQRPNYVVRLGEVTAAGTPGQPFAIEQIRVLPDQIPQLQFRSEYNRDYQVEYSNDLLQWFRVPQPVLATGRLTQWLDDGPPKTIRPPGTEGARFYRVTEAPLAE